MAGVYITDVTKMGLTIGSVTINPEDCISIEPKLSADSVKVKQFAGGSHVIIDSVAGSLFTVDIEIKRSSNSFVALAGLASIGATNFTASVTQAQNLSIVAPYASAQGTLNMFGSNAVVSTPETFGNMTNTDDDGNVKFTIFAWKPLGLNYFYS